MLKRKIYEKLLDWKHSSHKKGLCITGARQVGKSTIAREFGRNEYESVLEVNFIRTPEALQDFTTRDPEQILLAVSTRLNLPVIPGRTLLILDEIQECPNARTAVKFLVEDGRVDVLETGSLLGVNIHAVASYPVGFEELLPMYPMDFEEFLWAMNTRRETLEYLKSCYKNLIPVSDSIHRQFLELFYRYMIVGGMPEAVQTYVSTGNISDVSIIQQRIMDLYRMDILKYAQDREKTRILDIFDSIPAQLNDKGNRFRLSKVRKSARMERFENSFLWLKEAGVALTCYNVSEVRILLLLNESRSLFRLFLCDTGLLTSCYSPDVQRELLDGNLQINCGSIMENMIAQALTAKETPLYYYDNKRTELDFIAQFGSKVHVLEIKSGNSYRNHPSLSRVLEDANYQIDRAVVLCKGNIEQKGKILYLPLYMIPFYEADREEMVIVDEKLSSLMGL